ncbi:sodium- and chloride-dependent glycine transporter 2-like [Physella acuta]|uniref:sodium- and chloride-dependent glycine transporter 2-like n=1 Tax=Physella acuta TaxID=109671 RepID=UPI0027DD441D|nr:sodium- and chloride-dependent glycine transporter 2-like [Physella acuta]XP_059155828.1 sodium- and chloride-dependent glycine transporter 2-like [Physella acuta]
MKEEVERGGWGGKLDFILTCIGYAVGLGNIWRFPYLCYKSGGGAFLIPYCLFLALCGLPLFFLEVTIGQFSSLSPVAIWKVVPLFKGVGVGMLCCTAIVCIYYNVIVAWIVYYLFMSFRSVLPWASCDNSWNTDRCTDFRGAKNQTAVAFLGNLSRDSFFNKTGDVILRNGSEFLFTKSNRSVPSSEEFWERHVLELSGGIDSPGTIRWQLLICLAFAWICVFFCLFKGVKVLGKVMHFAAPFPYLVLLVLLVRGCTLPGAIEGIKFYIVPRWEKLADYTVWGDAALQIFYSVGMAWGGIITMASYNKFSNNVYRDSMIVPLVNCGTSVFAGFAIFSVLGYMAHEANTSVDEIVTQGPGLTFVAYPQALATLPISPLWSVLFFLMLFTVGLDSQFGMLETILSGVMDEYPQALRRRKTAITAVACFVEFLLGLPCITQGGIYVLQIMDWYCASFSLMLISLAECMALAWAYGADSLARDIALMIGYKPHFWWKYMWKYITPTVVLFIWVFSVITLTPVTYGDYSYPSWAVAIGWLLAVISVIPIPMVAMLQILKTEGSFIERLKLLLRPDPTWGPSKPDDRRRYNAALGKFNMEAVAMMGNSVDYSNNNGCCDESSLMA